MNLISKKDLLAITGISYGQLYRWKRERLIPEEWFIKQSSYTGQETFFPREQILSRVKSILELKDIYSLEELAKLLSPESSPSKITIEDLADVEEIDKGILGVLPEVLQKDSMEFIDVVIIVAISKAVAQLDLSEEQKEELLGSSISAGPELKNINVSCTVFQVGKEYHIAFTANSAPIVFDSRIKVKEQISLSEIADLIKLKYKTRFIK